MKAIILAAGQGRRLLPHTESTPKCMLPVIGDVPVLGVQLAALAQCGVDEVSVMVGFQAEEVERYLANNPIPGLRVRTCYNPFYETSDNLVTCWLARPEMAERFILLNGDTLFEPAVLGRLLTTARGPLTLVINHKAEGYDDDDMKVALNGGRRLRAVGKTLDPEIVGGESIGLMMFQGAGVRAFKEALDIAVRSHDGVKAWYLSVVNALADQMRVETTSITGLWWGEVDSPEDLAYVRGALEELHPKPLERFDLPRLATG